jgi:hypothetical protein
MKKKLPLIADILKCLERSGADYFIYTNMDIALRPYFYSAVARIIAHCGNEALIINRRRLPEALIDVPEKIIETKGEKHPGYDCFVFHRSLLEKLDLGNTAVGVPGIGFHFAHALFLATAKCEVLTEEDLTYHLGMEIVKPWAEQEVEQYQFNGIRKFLRKHKKDFSVSHFPGYHLPFFKRHRYWLMSPLFSYPMMLRLDMKALFDGRSIDREGRKASPWREWKLQAVMV